jgi:hypothetical protein
MTGIGTSSPINNPLGNTSYKCEHLTEQIASHSRPTCQMKSSFEASVTFGKSLFIFIDKFNSIIKLNFINLNGMKLNQSLKN